MPADTTGKSAPFRVGSCCNPCPPGYRAAFACSLVLYPQPYRLALRLAFPRGRATGLPRCVAETAWVRPRLYAGGSSSAWTEFSTHAAKKPPCALPSRELLPRASGSLSSLERAWRPPTYRPMTMHWGSLPGFATGRIAALHSTDRRVSSSARGSRPRGIALAAAHLLRPYMKSAQCKASPPGQEAVRRCAHGKDPTGDAHHDQASGR
jgi:hypothetical protein